MTNKLFVLLLAAISVVSYDFFRVQPQRDFTINTQTKANSTLQLDLQTALQARDKVAALKLEIAQTTQLINQLLTRLPRRSEAGTLLEQITSNPAQGMRFEAVNPRGTTRKSVNVQSTQSRVNGVVTYEEMELGLEVLTTFRHLGKYLESLEKIPRLVEVVGLKLTSNGPGKPLAVKLSVKTYIYGG